MNTKNNDFKMQYDLLMNKSEAQYIDSIMIMHAKQNNLAGVKDTLLKGADIHASSNAAILYAAINDNVEMVDYLLFSPELKIHATDQYAHTYQQTHYTPQVENFMMICDSGKDTLNKLLRTSFASDSFSVLKYILTDAKIINKPSLTGLSNFVTKRTSVAMMMFLLDSDELQNKLDPKDANYGLYENAVKNNNVYLLQLLLIDKIPAEISSSQYQLLINNLAKLASRSAKFDILKFLTSSPQLPLKPVLEFDNCAVLFNAMINKDQKIMEYLIFDKNIYVSNDDMKSWRHSIEDMSLLSEMLAKRKLYNDLQKELPSNNNTIARSKV